MLEKYLDMNSGDFKNFTESEFVNFIYNIPFIQRFCYTFFVTKNKIVFVAQNGSTYNLKEISDNTTKDGLGYLGMGFKVVM